MDQLIKSSHFLIVVTRLKGVLKSSGPCPEHMFAGRCGRTAVYEELTPGLLEFKAAAVFMAFMTSTAV